MSGRRDNRPEMEGGIDLSSNFADIFGPTDLVTIPMMEEIGLLLDDDDDEEMNEDGSDVVTIGGEDKQIANNVNNPPSTSNVYVKSTFSDNSKISYILEYGAGAVI